ncbi:hypothetical protein BBD42_30995 [Paenibacillus sp. BIHB 4019]|uniref:Uncharacterized protein n=1 Tax=Paenibacillus sp. BIHB 4019 TaxID=1870819 RepID=A0A1B2DRU6_9BACL|nr:hypothetical protein [Paenibacillus sp. BIHB 4019]ANY70432.1 hypothetical protein BBD42_30995 [Paenibacillus sp. BIHB 4019]
MLQQALRKLQADIGSADKVNKYVPVIGGFLINHIRENPTHSHLILVEGKSVEGSIQAMQQAAIHSNGALTDEEAFAIVLQYFGVSVPKKEAEAAPVHFNVSLDDLL